MIGIAYPAFLESFKVHFPNLKLIGDQNISNFDLIIFSGGEDISPSIYNEKPGFLTGSSEYRDKIEIDVLKKAIKHDVPILGICRGHQLINAFLGGKLIQHLIPSHRDPHEIFWKSFFEFRDSLGDVVNSYHHQAVEVPGKNLVPFIFEQDSETIEGTVGKRILTLQCHPEFYSLGTETTKIFRFMTSYLLGEN